jgi:hypothetical protein
LKSINAAKLKIGSLKQPMINLVKNARESILAVLGRNGGYIITDVMVMRNMEEDIVNNCMSAQVNKMGRS